MFFKNLDYPRRRHYIKNDTLVQFENKVLMNWLKKMKLKRDHYVHQSSRKIYFHLFLGAIA